MRALVVGVGALGARAARQLLTLGDIDDLAVADEDPATANAVARSLGGPARSVETDDLPFADVDVVVLAHPSPTGRAREALAAGANVVVCGGLADTARALLSLDAEARERGRNVVVGAAFSPGLSCLLAGEAARRFDEVTSIAVASFGVGGPACLAERRRSLVGQGLRWDGAWHRERAGSGRQIAAFPDPVGSKDCFTAATAEVLLLADAFPTARASASVAATAVERATAFLPTPAKRRARVAGLGALRVEVHGLSDGVASACVLGAIDRPELAGGAVAAVAARWAGSGRLHRPGAAGLAALVEDPKSFLAELATLGVRGAEYFGTL